MAFVPGPENQRAFRDALGRFATGVTVVTTEADGNPLGITVNSFASLSLDPPLVLWAPARWSRRFAAFEAAGRFAIHVIGSHQRDVAQAFVRDGGAFDRIDWHRGAEAVPLIEGCLARFDCTRWAVHDGGDHAIVVGRVEAVDVGEGEPLLFTGGEWGHFTAAA